MKSTITCSALHYMELYKSIDNLKNSVATLRLQLRNHINDRRNAAQLKLESVKEDISTLEEAYRQTLGNLDASRFKRRWMNWIDNAVLVKVNFIDRWLNDRFNAKLLKHPVTKTYQEKALELVVKRRELEKEAGLFISDVFNEWDTEYSVRQLVLRFYDLDVWYHEADRLHGTCKKLLDSGDHDTTVRLSPEMIRLCGCSDSYIEAIGRLCGHLSNKESEEMPKHDVSDIQVGLGKVE